MPEYRRSIIEGGTFFFTVVTYNRLPILTSSEARKRLRAAWENVRDRFPFVIDAVCLLLEHIHSIWRLPEGDADDSKRWGEIKRLLTKGYLGQIGAGEIRNESRKRRGEAASGMVMVEFSPACEDGILRAGMGRSGWGGGEEDGLWVVKMVRSATTPYWLIQTVALANDLNVGQVLGLYDDSVMSVRFSYSKKTEYFIPPRDKNIQ